MRDKPKLIIYNRDGTVAEVEPLPMWQPCYYEDGICIYCGAKEAEHEQ